MVTEAQSRNNAELVKQQKLGSAMYRPTRQQYGHPLSSYFDQLEAQLRWKNDREGLARSARAKQQVEAWAAKRNVSPDSLWRGLLARQLEFDTRPKSEEAIEARRHMNWQRLVEESGGEAAARAIIERGAAKQTEFYREVPDLVHRTKHSFEDLDIVKFFANDVSDPIQSNATQVPAK